MMNYKDAQKIHLICYAIYMDEDATQLLIILNSYSIIISLILIAIVIFSLFLVFVKIVVAKRRRSIEQ